MVQSKIPQLKTGGFLALRSHMKRIQESEAHNMHCQKISRFL